MANQFGGIPAQASSNQFGGIPVVSEQAPEQQEQTIGGKLVGAADIAGS